MTGLFKYKRNRLGSMDGLLSIFYKKMLSINKRLKMNLQLQRQNKTTSEKKERKKEKKERQKENYRNGKGVF